MELLHIILPVATGALIGYCTNYIAIKMLFRPRKEYYIGNWKVPFTPGVIPKNQPRIASAIGNAISEKLLTQEDIAESIKKSGIKEQFVGKVMDFIMQNEDSLQTLITDAVPEADIESATDIISEMLSIKILNGIQKMDMTAVVNDIVQSTFADLLSNPMLAMFGGGNLVNSICDKIGNAITEYLEEHGQEVVTPMVKQEVEQILSNSLKSNLDSLTIRTDTIGKVLGNVIERFIENNIANWLSCLNIKAIVEDKINEMDVKDLEELVLSVMKNELQTVINLGAVLGAIIGTINIFF